MVFGCTSTTLDEFNKPIGGGPCDSTYVFNGKISRIIVQNCAGIQHSTGCHTGGVSQGDFTTYAGIKDKVDNGSFLARVIEDKDMPPGYSPGPDKLSDCDLKVLKNWINDGAPQ